MYTFLRLSIQINGIEGMHSLTAVCIHFCVYLHKSLVSTKCILSLLNVYLFAFIYTNQWYRRNAFSHCCMYTFLRLSTQIIGIDEMHFVTAECIPFCVYLYKSMVSTECILSLLNVYLFAFIYTNQWYRRNAFCHCWMYTFCVYLYKSMVSTECILTA